MDARSASQASSHRLGAKHSFFNYSHPRILNRSQSSTCLATSSNLDDSDLSDDEHQYHSSTDQLWDSFWQSSAKAALSSRRTPYSALRRHSPTQPVVPGMATPIVITDDMDYVAQAIEVVEELQEKEPDSTPEAESQPLERQEEVAWPLPATPLPAPQLKQSKSYSLFPKPLIAPPIRLTSHTRPTTPQQAQSQQGPAPTSFPSQLQPGQSLVPQTMQISSRRAARPSPLPLDPRAFSPYGLATPPLDTPPLSAPLSGRLCPPSQLSTPTTPTTPASLLSPRAISPALLSPKMMVFPLPTPPAEKVTSVFEHDEDEEEEAPNSGEGPDDQRRGLQKLMPRLHKRSASETRKAGRSSGQAQQPTRRARAGTESSKTHPPLPLGVPPPSPGLVGTVWAEKEKEKESVPQPDSPGRRNKSENLLGRMLGRKHS